MVETEREACPEAGFPFVMQTKLEHKQINFVLIRCLRSQSLTANFDLRAKPAY
jgi:hypothetical protein